MFPLHIRTQAWNAACAATLCAALGSLPDAHAAAPPALDAPALSLNMFSAQKPRDYSQMSLDQLMEVRVSTISRVSERIDLAPGSIYAFDHDTLSLRGYRSLGELLRTVPGFTVFHKDLGYVAGVRGLNANDNEKISLLINGQNVNGVNEPDFLNGPINLVNAKSAEVVVGPSSLFQQANTLAATVNILTRDVEGVVLETGAGNYLNYSTTVMAGHQFSPAHNFTLSITTEDKRGFNAFEPDFRPNLVDRHQVGELDQPNYFAIAKGQNGELFGQVIAYRTTLPELNLDNGSPLNNAKLTDEIYTAYGKLEHQLSPSLMAVVSADIAYKRQSRQNEDGLPVNGLQQCLSQMTLSSDWGLQYTGIKNNLLQVGIQGTYDDNLSDWYTLNPATGDPLGLTVPKTTLFTQDTYAVGGYLDEEYQLTPQIKVIGGARIDRNTRLESDRWYPGFRAAVVVEPTSAWVSKVVYNRAVRFPSPLAALNRAWGAGVASAPDWAALAPNATEPEILSTIEWQNVVYLDKNRVSLTLYHQELQDFISWYGPHTNVGNFRGNGAELSIECPVTHNLNLWANASYNISKLRPFSQYSALAVPDNPAGGLILPTDTSGHIIGAPQVTANMGLEYEFLKDVTIAPSVRYFTDQTAFNYDTGTFTEIRNRFYVDTTLTWKHVLGNKNLDMHLSGYNLLNNRSPVGGQWLRDTYRPEGTSFVFSMELRF